MRLERVAGRLSPQAIGDRVARCAERVQVLHARARQSMLNGVARHRRHLDASAKLLASLSYQGVLQRGFALVRDSEGRSVRTVARVAAGQRLDIELADGHVKAEAVEIRKPGEDQETVPRVRRNQPMRLKTGQGGGTQGSLF